MLAHTTQALAELVAEEAEKLSSDIAAAEAAAARVEQMMAASSGAGAGDSAAVAQAGQAVAEEMHRLSDRMAAADVAAACLEQMAAAAGSQGAAGNPALAAQIQAAQAAAQAIAGEVAKLSSNYAEAPLQQQVCTCTLPCCNDDHSCRQALASYTNPLPSGHTEFDACMPGRLVVQSTVC
jgi:hypothetical protein